MSSLIENAKPNFSLTQATKSRRAVKKSSQQACPNQTLAGLAERRLGQAPSQADERSRRSEFPTRHVVEAIRKYSAYFHAKLLGRLG